MTFKLPSDLMPGTEEQRRRKRMLQEVEQGIPPRKTGVLSGVQDEVFAAWHDLIG